ncbi:MAG TPA: DUF2505 domain-containing protein [Mycobacteriales bacterium]|jgi:hypothetical protein|nr:DUF2505 domain-containing protein [Mycobacteriales bacterium]
MAKIRIEHDYAADVETVYALISDPEYVERKYVALGGRDVSVDRSETDDGGCKVVTKRTITVDLPGFASKVLTPTQSPIQAETWLPAGAAGERACNYTVEAPGTPSRIVGTHRLTPTASGCHHTIDIDAKVNIPLIGGKIEKFAAEQGRADIEAQFAHTDAELATPSA